MTQAIDSEETLILLDPPAEREPAQSPAQGTLPRLLVGIPAHGAMSLREHLQIHGPMPVESRRRGWRAGRARSRNGQGNGQGHGDGDRGGYGYRDGHGRGEVSLIEDLEHAGLRGQGGAGFPTGAKLRAVAEQGKRAVVVVNAAEGEPASLKDRTLMQALPHLVLDGAQLAARAVGAKEVIVCVCESAPASAQYAAQAVAERETASARRVSGEASVQLASVPGGYVAGQETALVNYLNGGPALPTFTPPMVFQQGVRRRPTLVCNAETFAHLALIARHGPDWFRELGMPSQPGSTLVTLAGAVRHPGVYEIEHGSALSSLIDAAGGIAAAGARKGASRGLANGAAADLAWNGPAVEDPAANSHAVGDIAAGGEPRALLVGGYGGSWIDGRMLRGVALSDEHLAPHDATLGAGVVCVLSPEACPVAEVARLTRWMAGQSAGQCGPCVHGLDAIASAVEQIVAGHGAEGRDAGGRGAGGRGAEERGAGRGGHESSASPASPAHAVGEVERLATLVNRRGACGHPDGVARMVASALQAFGPEWADHAMHGPCEGCERVGELPLPTPPRAAAPVSSGRGPRYSRETTRRSATRQPLRQPIPRKATQHESGARRAASRRGTR